MSVFLRWVTVATFANTASALKVSGWVADGLSERNWTVGMLLVPGALALSLIVASRGNVGYALTVLWALIGIVVANTVGQPNRVVAGTAGAMVALVVPALLIARFVL